MDLRTLRYFIAVLEAGSLSRAAGALYVAQPALTAQIKKLESELGVQLFERSHAGVTPTSAGLRLYDDARRLLSDADAMRERIQRLPQGPEGSVTLAIPFLLASLLMGPVLAALKESHPRVRVFVLDGLSLTVCKAVLERRADVGILVDTPPLEGLRCRPMAREGMYFCGRDTDGRVARLLRAAPTVPAGRRRPAKGDAGAAASQYPVIDLADAAAQPLVLQSRRFAIRQSVEGAANARGMPLNIVHEHDSARVIRSLYLNGAGFTFVPACALSDSPPPREGWLVARVVNPELSRAYTLVTPERPLDAVAQVVVDALTAEAKSLIGQRKWMAEWTMRG
ncbi:LysR family transcriptional regulator [Variovorax sp. 22077]|uniref:LysR family transcriptional regulator n=1 Tax=Variovorax sp. 22077 TaxID=3453867 RepID=UPI003F8327F9